MYVIISLEWDFYTYVNALLMLAYVSLEHHEK